MDPLVVIGGPTAIGKSRIAVGLAKIMSGEIISADSMQVYKGMDIGTAKITSQEQQGIKHYLIDELDPREDFNVFEFKSKADEYINKIYSKGKLPVITGGTGFYVQAVLKGIDFNIEEDRDYRKYLEDFANDNKKELLFDMLKEVDPYSASNIHPNNIKRVIRALEYHHLNGHMISEHNEVQKIKPDVYKNVYFVLNRNREHIYEKINKRVDKMIADGLVDEVVQLINRGVSRTSTSMQGLGYKEIYDYLDGNITLDEAISKIKQNTRHFAKRQITWYKREKNAVWIDMDKYSSDEEIIESIKDQYKERLKNV